MGMPWITRSSGPFQSSVPVPYTYARSPPFSSFWMILLAKMKTSKTQWWWWEYKKILVICIKDLSLHPCLPSNDILRLLVTQSRVCTEPHGADKHHWAPILTSVPQHMLTHLLLTLHLQVTSGVLQDPKHGYFQQEKWALELRTWQLFLSTSLMELETKIAVWTDRLN